MVFSDFRSNHFHQNYHHYGEKSKICSDSRVRPGPRSTYTKFQPFIFKTERETNADVPERASPTYINTSSHPVRCFTCINFTKLPWWFKFIMGPPWGTLHPKSAVFYPPTRWLASFAISLRRRPTHRRAVLYPLLIIIGPPSSLFILNLFVVANLPYLITVYFRLLPHK